MDIRTVISTHVPWNCVTFWHQRVPWWSLCTASRSAPFTVLFDRCLLGGSNWTVLLADPFWLRKITTNSDILAHVNTECPDDRYQELNIFMLELISGSYQYTPVAYVKNALHGLARIKLTVARCFGTGGFLIRYYNRWKQLLFRVCLKLFSGM
jgi:hypothetical protein